MVTSTLANTLKATAPDERVWRGSDFSQSSSWVTQIGSEVIADLTALAQTLPLPSEGLLDCDLTSKTSPRLSQFFQAVSKDLTAGKGFALLRGVPADDPELLRRVFWLVAHHLGTPVMQNAQGEVLSEVFDRYAGAERGVDTRGYESNDELRFHCDGGDCIGMSCVRQSPIPCTNGLVSLFAIYEEMLLSHPQHLAVLERGYALYARKEKGDAESTAKLGKVSDSRIPVFAWQNGYMSAWLNIQLSELAAAVSGQSMTDEEVAALQCVEQVAEQTHMKLSFVQQPGDILWVNNLAVMHRRNKYEDGSLPEEKRLLFRMWINFHDVQPVVRQHAALRGGIKGPMPTMVGP